MRELVCIANAILRNQQPSANASPDRRSHGRRFDRGACQLKAAAAAGGSATALALNRHALRAKLNR